eukprot:jgi/Chrzof1/14884/Cz09g19150.t1
MWRIPAAARPVKLRAFLSLRWLHNGSVYQSHVNGVDSRALQSDLCEAALKHVKNLGWSHNSLIAASKDLHLSPAIVGILPRRESSLVEYFITKNNQQLQHQLQDMQGELSSMKVTQQVHTAVRRRLEMNEEYIDSWPQALSILGMPRNSPHGLRLLGSLVDDIWYACGDKSTDSSWYTKRMLLAGVYSSTELYMLTDFSPGYQDTWDYLDRRIADVLRLGKATQQLGDVLQNVLGVVQAGIRSSTNNLSQSTPLYTTPAAHAHNAAVQSDVSMSHTQPTAGHTMSSTAQV